MVPCTEEREKAMSPAAFFVVVKFALAMARFGQLEALIDRTQAMAPMSVAK